MYVFITVTELTGPEKQVSLGQVEDDVTLTTLLNQCLERVDQRLPEQKREDYRHFWFNDRFVPYDRAYLRDLASTVNVTLELRPDNFKVKLLDQSEATYAINPEEKVSKTIDLLLGKQEAWRCYELLPCDGQPLQEDSSLFSQKILPYHGRQSQIETTLVVRRKSVVIIWSVLIMIVFIGAGLLLGFLAARLFA